MHTMEKNDPKQQKHERTRAPKAPRTHLNRRYSKLILRHSPSTSDDVVKIVGGTARLPRSVNQVSSTYSLSSSLCLLSWADLSSTDRRRRMSGGWLTDMMMGATRFSPRRRRR